MIQNELIVAILIGIGSLFCLLSLLRAQLPKYFAGESANLKRVISSQGGYNIEESNPTVASASLLQSIEEVGRNSNSHNRVPLERKFKYANWKMSTLLFRGFEISVSLLLFSLAALKFNLVIQIAALFGGPLLMHGLLSRSINSRTRLFDQDYAQFLMQVVGLLKTGMTAMTAIQEASKGLEPHSLVRKEVNLMIARVRFGILEDRSIGAFAENVNHPEIELFVEALLLSRRLGGNLSETLERLSKQVRKRQYFRSAAEAAMGLQRGSLWVIIGILISVEGYIALLYPDLVLKALQTELGFNVWQICFLLIAIGFLWIRQVTKFKI